MSTATPEAVTQTNRPIGVTTDLGADKLLLEQFSCSEGLSRPFRLSLSMLAAPDYTVPFDQLMGQSAAVRLDVPGGGESRFFHGLVFRLTEGPKVHSPDTGKFFRRYWAEVMPAFVSLRFKVQSRTFQHLSVPDILKKVLTGFDVSYELKGTFQPRDYCVQYRESDFDFASRLMEEEGIFYFFKHTQSSHTMVLANDPSSHADLPSGAAVKYSEFKGLRDAKLHEDRVSYWRKSQEMRSGKYTAWDYTFEEPAKNLEASDTIQATAAAGTVTHKLKVGGNDQWEVYEFPGGYAERFDGVDKSGGPQPSELGKIEQDNTRTVGIRMKQIAVQALLIDGKSNVRGFLPGYKFELTEHFNGNGKYVLTEVEHTASMEGTYTKNEAVTLQYVNSFRCIPSAVTFRPQRVTAKPTIHGTQTAMVVGNDASTEIATDKYGRIKVQFHWDREGKNNLDSSCWVRVSQPWAGKRWGAFFLPRVGDEVVVAFEEGDPDQPIVVGSVYNSDHMAPYDQPDNKTRSYIKTRSSEKGTADNFNELRFEDKKDSEEIYFHAEKDFNRVVENNDTLKVGFDKKDKGDQTIEIYNDRTVSLDQGNESFTVKTGTRTVTVQKDDTHTVKDGSRTVTVQNDDKHEVKTGNLSVKVNAGNASYTITQGKCTIEAMQSIELKVGSTSIKLTPTGITMQSTMIKIQGDGMVQNKAGVFKVAADVMVDMQGTLVKIN